jgi:hypothetical protein
MQSGQLGSLFRRHGGRWGLVKPRRKHSVLARLLRVLFVRCRLGEQLTRSRVNRTIAERHPDRSGRRVVAEGGADELGCFMSCSHVIEGLRQQAASLGCDTVIRVKVDQGAAMASGTGVAIRTLAARPAPAQSSPGASNP